MKFTAFHPITPHRESPRLWNESEILRTQGFDVGTQLTVAPFENGVVIRPVSQGDRQVSFRRSGGGQIPIIDINDSAILANFAGVDFARWNVTVNRIEVHPSIRSMRLLSGRRSRSVYRVLDVFAGGGTASDALAGNPRFEVVAAIELDTIYAAEYSRKHPNADIYQGDFRTMDIAELPCFEGIVAGIPCTEHSSQGRAKKSLAGIPELGEAGDLYLPLLALTAARMPSWVCLENVPAFGCSLAGRTVVSHLRKLGYFVDAQVVEPNQDYAEPTTRNRWICFATLAPGFSIPNPHTPFAGAISDYLDAPNPEADRHDAEKIARTIACLRRHNARHTALGHRFAMTVLNGTETSCPTLTKSYSKLNSSGAYVSTEWGPRALRAHEVCRLHGHSFSTRAPGAIYEMSGQGVLTRMFRGFFEELGRFLP